MKYMLLFTMADTDAVPPADLEERYRKVGEWWEAHSRSGELLSGEQLQPPRSATTVRPGTGSVTDGPFIEAKEGIGGFAIIEVPDLDRAIELAKSWPASSQVEIRPLAGMDHEHQ